MRFFRMYFKGYKKNIFFRVIIFLQVCIAAFSINSALSFFEYSRQIENIPSEYMKSHGVIIGMTYERSNNIDEGKINETIRNLPGIDQIGNSSSFSSPQPDEDNNPITFISYPEFIFTDMNKIKLIKGNINDHGYHDGINNVYVSSDTSYEYGKEYEIMMYTKGSLKPQPIKVRIAGIFSTNTYLLCLSVGSSDNSFKNLYVINNSKTVVLADVRDEAGNAVQLSNISENTIIRLKKDINFKDVRGEWEKSLTGHAAFSTMQESIQINSEGDVYKGKKTWSVAIVLITLCLLGVGSNAIIKVLRESREYGIYFMCGQKWSQCIIYNALSNIIDVILPFCVGLIAAKLMSVTDFAFSSISANNILISFGVILIIFILTGAWSILYLAKMPPISFLRRNKA